MVAVVEKIPPDLSTSKLDGIQRRLAELFEERPDGPFHFPDILRVTGRSPNSHGRPVKVAIIIDAIFDRYGIDRGLMSRGGSSLPKEVVIKIAEAIGEPNPRNQEQGRRRAEALHDRTARLSSAGVIMEANTDGVQAVEHKGERRPLTLEDKELIVFADSLANTYERDQAKSLGILMTVEDWELAKAVRQELDDVVISPEDLIRLRRDFPAKLSLAIIAQRQALLEQNPRIAELLELFFGFRNTEILRWKLEWLLE